MSENPSLSSYYVGNEFYQNLVDNFTDWQGDAREIDDIALRDSCRRLLEREARLLEARQYDDWLALYALECLYWVPTTVEGGDPRREIAISFDDRRRLGDRIFRLKHDHAWSQMPASRTARIIANVTVFSTKDTATYMVRSTFLTTEFQAGDKRTHTGWYGHRIREEHDGWKILVKQVNLIDCDQNLRNPSIVF